MRISLSTRAAAASAAVALLLSPGLETALARTQSTLGSPVMRPAIVHRHDQTQGPSNSGRYSWTWRNRYGRNHRSGNGWLWDQSGFYGSDFWYLPSGVAGAARGVGASVIVTAAPPLNDFPGAGEAADPNAEGGCVIHKLIYDRDGKYVGERQIPEC